MNVEREGHDMYDEALRLGVSIGVDTEPLKPSLHTRCHSSTLSCIRVATSRPNVWHTWQVLLMSSEYIQFY